MLKRKVADATQLRSFYILYKDTSKYKAKEQTV